jgi:hypothetical protein
MFSMTPLRYDAKLDQIEVDIENSKVWEKPFFDWEKIRLIKQLMLEARLKEKEVEEEDRLKLK